VEVGEVGIGVDFSNIDVNIADSMGAIHNEGNALLLEEGLESVHGEDDARHRANVVHYHHLDLLRIAVHELFHSKLNALGSLEILSSEDQLF
jgi:hypothetical protein